MLIKSADDKTKRLKLLLDLQSSPLLDKRQKDWLHDELHRQRRGMQGEREAAHYIDSHYADDKNYAVLHDLRIEVDGQVAQIDHLIMARGFNFYLLETKNFSGNVTINEHGEFSVAYAGERVYGIPSPIEQSRRHEVVLTKLLQKLGIAGRLAATPRYRHLVLVHPSSQIKRPDPNRFDSSMVIKADQFQSWHQKHADAMGFGDVMVVLADMRSTDTLKEWGESIGKAHKPANLLELPEFLAPKPPPAKFSAESTSNPSSPPIQPPKKELICVTCKSKISRAEGFFCWGNERRFAGRQYCREHQKAFA